MVVVGTKRDRLVGTRRDRGRRMHSGGWDQKGQGYVGWLGPEGTRIEECTVVVGTRRDRGM